MGGMERTMPVSYNHLLLEPADVVRVVDDAHAICLVVLDFVVVGNH